MSEAVIPLLGAMVGFLAKLAWDLYPPSAHAIWSVAEQKDALQIVRKFVS